MGDGKGGGVGDLQRKPEGKVERVETSSRTGGFFWVALDRMCNGVKWRPLNGQIPGGFLRGCIK